MEVGGEVVEAGFGDVGVGVVEARHREVAGEVDDFGVRAFEGEHLVVAADGDDVAVSDGEGVHARGNGIVVVGLQVNASEDLAMKEEGVGGGRLWLLAVGGNQEGERCAEEGEAAHDLSLVRSQPARVAAIQFASHPERR